MNPLIALCLFPAALGPATPAATARSMAVANAEAVRVTLIDQSLRATPAELVRVQAGSGGIDAGSRAQLIYLDAKRNRVTLDAGPDFPLAIAPDGWIIVDPADLTTSGRTTPVSRANTSAPWIELVDGQRLIGNLLIPTDADDGQTIRWTHPRLGAQQFALDRVRRLWQGPPELLPTLAQRSSSARADSDSVILRNGDRLSCYVESFGSQLTLMPEPAPGAPKAEPFSVPAEQVAFLELGNPPAPRRGILLYLADGGVIAAPRLEVDAAAGRITLAMPEAPVNGEAAPGGSLDFADLRALALESSRLTALSSLPIASHQPIGDRRIAPPPQISPITPGLPSPLDADDILLEGPIQADWELPGGAARLAGWITLEPPAMAWGDCIVTVSVVGPGTGDSAANVLARQRINAAKPIMPLNVPLAPSEERSHLRITVEAGENGPVLDHIRLRRMLLTLQPSAAPSR
jgi:hypothetical protein